MASDAVRARARLVGVAAAAGAAAGTVAFPAGVAWFGAAGLASRKLFALGALLFGFALLGWSGSIMAGRSLEAAQQHFGTATNWTEARSRRAMARVGGFGAGWMVGTSLAAAVLG